MAFAFCYATGEDSRDVHVAAGYLATVMVTCRVVWGFIGPDHARFHTFLKPPRVTLAFLWDMLQCQEARYIGHNPAGGAMIIALLLLVTMTGVSGILLTTDAFWGSDSMDYLHGILANVALCFILLHLAGVLWTSFRTRENLVASMLTGKKRATPHGDCS